MDNEDAQAAQEASRSPLFWKCARTGHPPMYFYGALHFGVPEMYPLPDCVEHAFDKCDTLAFEVDLEYTGSSSFNMAIHALGQQPDNCRLSDSISNNVWERLCSIAASLGISGEYLDGLKSWYCASMLTSTALRNTGLASCLGIDGYLFRRALEHGGKNIECLETPDEQLELLSSINPGNVEEFILATLEEMKALPAFSRRLLELWMAGDAETLSRLVADNFSPSGISQEKMLFERNARWLKKLEKLNGLGQCVLTVVGAGHLVGDGSLISLFRQAGYELLTFGFTES